MTPEPTPRSGKEPRPGTPGPAVDLRLTAGLHDLGNLLQVALSASEEGLASSEERELRAALQGCRAATQRAVELVRKLASQAAGEPAPHRPRHGRGTEVLPVVRDVFELARITTPDGTSLRLLEASDPGTRGWEPRVRVEASLLHRALLNLLRNACEAVEAGGEVVTSVAPAPGGGVEIQVRDDGPGMREDVLAHATEQGFSTRGEGRGLGLAFVRALALDTGGDLQLESHLGRGTTVRLILPLAG